MKCKTHLLVGLFAAAMLLVGCQQVDTRAVKESDYDEISGTWQAEKSQRAITIDNRGNLVSFSYGRGLTVNVSEGGLLKEGQMPGMRLYMILGDTAVEYNKISQYMKVVIHYDDYLLEMPNRSFSGQMTEVFEGQISIERQEWLANLTITGTVENLPEMNDTTKTSYLFRKVD